MWGNHSHFVDPKGGVFRNPENLGGFLEAVSSRFRAERAGINTMKRRSNPGSWNSMGKGPKQPSLASSRCLISAHSAPCPQSGPTSSEKGPQHHPSLLSAPDAKSGLLSSCLRESRVLPRTASLARPACASPIKPI